MDLIDLWSGATPYLTSPYGVGSRSMTSTRIRAGGSSAAACLISASAVYRPAGPEPMTATSIVSIVPDCALSAVVPGSCRRRPPGPLPSGTLLVRQYGGTPGHRRGDLACQVLRGQPAELKDLAPVTVRQELPRQPEAPHRGVDLLLAQHPGHPVAEPAGHARVLHGDHQPVRGGRAGDRLVGRDDP